MDKTQIYLIPGFFGFAQLGTLDYFHRVSEVLSRELTRRGVKAEIIEVKTRPTSSIRRRAISLLKTASSHGCLKCKNLHFIGHSTGGLDLRLLLTPGVRLRPSKDEEKIARKAKSAITLSTPHFGTPLANFFTSLNGRNLLYLLAIMVTSSPGRLGVYMGARLLSMVAHLDDYIGQKGTILDSLSEKLFRHITPDQGNELWEFLRDISHDQGAMVQLTPEAADLFNASVPDREGVDYVSFVTAAPPPRPSWSTWKGANLYNPITMAIYAASYLIASREHRNYPYPSLAKKLRNKIQAKIPFRLTRGTNDGIVPTLSQIWAKLGDVIVGDHLDVVGQFPQVVKGKRYAGWLHSGANFREEQFQKLWSDIANIIVRANDK